MCRWVWAGFGRLNRGAGLTLALRCSSMQFDAVGCSWCSRFLTQSGKPWPLTHGAHCQATLGLSEAPTLIGTHARMRLADWLSSQTPVVICGSAGQVGSSCCCFYLRSTASVRLQRRDAEVWGTAVGECARGDMMDGCIASHLRPASPFRTHCCSPFHHHHSPFNPHWYGALTLLAGHRRTCYLRCALL